MPKRKLPKALVDAKERYDASGIGLDAAGRRNRGLNDLATTVKLIYGPRCTRRQGGCMTCAAWAAFDLIETLTEAPEAFETK